MKPLSPLELELLGITNDYNALKALTGVQINALRRWAGYKPHSDLEFMETEIPRLTEKVRIENALEENVG